MLRIITPAAPVPSPNSATIAPGLALVRFLAIPHWLWRRHRLRAGMRAVLHISPRLMEDSGMMMEDVEEMADAPFWQSAHVPPLRHF
jgi:hypothetical protein